MSLKDATNPGVMGVVGKCVVTKNDTLFLEGAGNADDVADRCEQIREAIQEEIDAEHSVNAALQSFEARPMKSVFAPPRH